MWIDLMHLISVDKHLECVPTRNYSKIIKKNESLLIQSVHVFVLMHSVMSSGSTHDQTLSSIILKYLFVLLQHTMVGVYLHVGYMCANCVGHAETSYLMNTFI